MYQAQQTQSGSTSMESLHVRRRPVLSDITKVGLGLLLIGYLHLLFYCMLQPVVVKSSPEKLKAGQAMKFLGYVFYQIAIVMMLCVYVTRMRWSCVVTGVFALISSIFTIIGVCIIEAYACEGVSTCYVNLDFRKALQAFSILYAFIGAFMILVQQCLYCYRTSQANDHSPSPKDKMHKYIEKRAMQHNIIQQERLSNVNQDHPAVNVIPPDTAAFHAAASGQHLHPQKRSPRHSPKHSPRQSPRQSQIRNEGPMDHPPQGQVMYTPQAPTQGQVYTPQAPPQGQVYTPQAPPQGQVMYTPQAPSQGQVMYTPQAQMGHPPHSEITNAPPMPMSHIESAAPGQVV